MSWSSGLASDGYHYLNTGTDALVVRTGSGTISANFMGAVGGAASDGNVIFYLGVKVLGALELGSVSVLSTLHGKADAANVYTKSET